MLIACIAGSRIPSRTANSIQVMKMCQAMAEENFRPRLIVPRYGSDDPSINESLWHHYGISHPFQVQWMPAENKLRNRLFQFHAAWCARSMGAKMVWTRHLGVAAVTSLLGIATIYEAHQPISGKLGPLYYRLFLMGRGGYRIVFISDALRRYYQANHSSTTGPFISVVHDGVDMEKYKQLPTPEKARRKLGVIPEGFTVGYAGHFYPGKGMELIIEIAERLKDINFLVVGGEPELIEGYKAAARNAHLGNIFFAGFQPNEQLPLFQAACDILLMPYQKKVHGSSGGDIAKFCSPLKMFEYMAAQRLIISSNLPVLLEVLNSSNSVLCDPEDIQAWVKSIEKAAEDETWRNSLAAQARKDVEQYSWRNRVRKILQ